jgi:RND family efflux transporter MFP subunit
MKCRSYLVVVGCLLCAVPVRADEKEVPVSRPIEQEVTEFADYTGRTQARETVELKARVTGYLVRVMFDDGAAVKKGDILAEIDARPYRAELERAQAKLTAAEAGLKLAGADRTRARNLVESKALSREELDRLELKAVQAESEVRVARAAVELAKLNLDYTKIIAPIDGHISRRYFDPRNLVKADETVMGTLFHTDPIYVYLDIDERNLLRLRRAWREAKLESAKVPVQVALVDEEGFPHQGTLDHVAGRVDPKTGTLRLRAVIANPRKEFLPGFFVRCRLAMGKPSQALLVSKDAISSEIGPKLVVMVVNEKGKIEARQVQVGQAVGELRVVKEGLKAGEWVVVGDRSKLRPGETVRTRRVAMPGAEEKAKP